MLRVFHGLSQAERMKDPVCLQTDVVVCCHQRIVGVDGRCLFIVVACADLGDIGDLCADLFGDETELAVYFQIVQTVDNAAAGIFQAAGPFDVVLLVESGTEFHQYHNILAVFGSLDQRLHDFAVGCDTIQGHLDGDHLGISASLVQQRQERTDALIGERQKTVLFLDLFDHALGQVTPCRFLRHTALIEQTLVVAEHIPYHRENGEIQRRLRVEYLFLCQIQIAAQRMDDGGIHQTGEFRLMGRAFSVPGSAAPLPHDSRILPPCARLVRCPHCG